MLSTPSTVGQRYHVLDLVGTGGMGSVYRVMDRLSRQTVALKRVTAAPDTLNFASRADDSMDFRLALAQEFQILASLRHPNIIGVLDYGFDADNQPYYTMDLLEDAQTILDAARDRSLSEKVALLAKLLQALSYLHRRGIIHRDLKPSNVLVAGGQVKVLDFGLSVRTEQNRSTGGTSGTLAYMAPEVLNGEPASIAADLYAVGVIAYEILVGQHPFITTDVSQLVIAILTQEPELTATGLEPPFVELLSRLLAKDPSDRYANTGAVLEALSAAASEPLALETQDIRESFLQAAQFVGRKDELAQLSDVLSQALEARKGSTWLVGGESGVGKSRLVEELRTLALVQGASVLRGQTVSEGGASYQLWRDSLRWLAMTSDLTDDEASVLKPLLPDIAELLDREVSDAPEIEAKAAVERVLSTIVNLIKRQTQPLLILLEDLQWASQEELAVLSRLKRAATTLPFMIVATYRDDERPNLPASLPDVRVIRLQRLSEADTAALTASILGTVSHQPQLLELLHRETEGNAFLLVEAMRSLAEEVGNLDRIASMTLPGRIIAGGTRQLIQRRLNRVPKESHALLQAAAAIGRQLDLDLLRTIDSEIDLENWLVTCSNAAVLDVQDNRWRFAHDKLREGLLESLTAEARQQLHNQVAGAMEAIYGDVPEQYSALAYQWGMAENPVREAHFARLAGDDAAHNYANADAVDHYTRAIEATRKSIRGAADQEQLAYLYTQRGRIFQLGGQYEQALKNYTDFGNAAVEFGDRKQELAALLEKITIYVTPTPEFSPDKGRTLLDQALALAHEINDPGAEAKVYWNMLNLSRFGGGTVADLVKYGEKAMALAREHNLKETLAYVLTDISQGYILSKQFDKGFQCLVEARVLWEELGDKPMLANVLCDNAEFQYVMGNYEMALKLGNEAYALTKSIDNLWGVAYAIMSMVDIYAEQGEIGIAFTMIAEGKIVSQQAGFMIARVQNEISLSRFLTYLGDFEQALAVQQTLVTNAELKDSPLSSYLGPISQFLECFRYLEMGEVKKALPFLGIVRQAAVEFHYNPQLVRAAKQIEVLMAFKQGDYTEVLRLYEEVQVAPQGEVPMELSLSIMQAQTLRALGKNDATYDLLQSARVYGEAQKIRLYLWEVYSELSQLEAERGAVDQAAAYRQQARDTINYVAEHCNDARLSETFLNRPKVHAVMVQ